LKTDTKKVTGKSFVFLGAKGGAGVTTAACNFAVSLAKATKRTTLLIDLDLPLGDAALNLGIANEFSTLDALRGFERLDPTFLMELVVRHSSGLYLLGAPGHFDRVPAADMTIDILIDTASQAFEYVVVDAGTRLDLLDTHLFDIATAIYLITQVGIPELRNSNRVITGALQPYLSKLEIVLNRYTAAMFEIGDEEIARALSQPAQWRIPNDFNAVREMQNTAKPLALKKSSIQRVIEGMAIKASGLQQESNGKNESLPRLSLFSGLTRIPAWRRAS
jgi:pilus assembly protein CpaE